MRLLIFVLGFLCGVIFTGRQEEKKVFPIDTFGPMIIHGPWVGTAEATCTNEYPVSSNPSITHSED